nr:claspin isoform X2 [Paramormyrops kingsleyae]
MTNVEKVPAVAQAVDSDSDSGMGSPQEEGTQQPCVVKEMSDSEDDILVNRKPRSRKALRDSDEEEGGAGLAEALILSESSEEDAGGAAIKAKLGSSKGKRVIRPLLESDESEAEAESQTPGRKRENKRQRSQRRREKSQKAKDWVKKNKRPQGSPVTPPLNDSGCLLGDNDLFDTGLEEGAEPEEEEGLDAIVASVKQKVKKHKSALEYEEDDEEEMVQKPQRKERKAALASKEAIKHLHSESQRLVRESSVGLPYHMPEPKSINQFYKRRTRPEGPAMKLLKSAQYQTRLLEVPSPPQPDQNKSKSENQADAMDPIKSLDNPPEAGPEAPLSVSQQPADLVPGSPAKDEGSLSTDKLLELSESTGDQTDSDTVGPQMASLESEEPLPLEPRLGQSKVAEPTEPSPAEPQPRKDRLARLRELGLHPAPVPRLCADDGAFVHLEPPQVNPALEALKERFLRHVQPAPCAQGERSMQLSIVRKDSSAPSGQQELLEESVTVTIGKTEKDVVHAKPGEKLVFLKSRLQQAMAQRRQEERERRAALHRLDNEDCEEEEEEEEMTDESDAEEGVTGLLGDDEHDDDSDVGEDDAEDNRRSNSPLALKGPSPPPDLLNTDGTLLLFAGSSSSRLGDGVRRPGASGPEGDTKLDEEDSLSLAKDNSHNSSFELIGSMLPSYQPINRSVGRGLPTNALRSPSPVFYRPSFLGSASKSSGKLSEPSLSLPVEDSQDLYAPSSPSEAGPLCAGSHSQGRFSLEEDTQSQLLDADGFLNVGPRIRAPAPKERHRRLLLPDSLDENAMDANMGELLGLCSGGFEGTAPRGSGGPGGDTQEGAIGELLGLCSGTFATQQDGGSPAEGPGALSAAAQEGCAEPGSQQAVEQLLGLCSGTFSSAGNSPAQPDGSQAPESPCSPSPREERRNEEEEEAEEEDCEFRLLSDVGSLSDEEGSVEEEGEKGSDSENEGEEPEAVLGVRRGKRKMHLAEFVESEAELSGSDDGSDDEEDEGGSEYEDEVQEELPSDEELQDQVNKIHMKQVLDDDKRRLRLYQERYLADGDLHSDGPGRTRRFRWKNIDNGFEMDDGDEEEDEEEEEELSQAEQQRRKERAERERWLREQSEAAAQRGLGDDDNDDEEENIGQEDSQFMKLAKKLTAKKLSQTEAPMAPKEKTAPSSAPFIMQNNVVRRGSLLSQPRAVLQKLASISDANPSAPRNSRGFLFQTLSPEKDTSAMACPKKQVTKRSQAESLAPAAKRPCLGPMQPPSGLPKSIFSYLER